MDVSVINETLTRYASGALTDAQLIEQIERWVADSPEGIEALRNAWPAERFPVVRDYFCVAQLGEGASGVVYTAVQLGEQPRMVALKLLRLIADADKRRFFEREVEILRRLDCPHVAHYLDSGSVGGTPFLAMERVTGLPLDEYLATHTPTLTDKLAVFERVVDAVGELHESGVIHRDLSPRHVLVDDDGVVRIVDLGLSAARGDDWATQVLRTQTQLGRVIGTLKYMSPEQAWGGLYDTDHRADIWALGVMLHEIATNGEYPYSLEPLVGFSPADSLLYRIQNEAPTRPQVRDPQYAGDLPTLISRCLAHEPRRRLGSTTELAGDLRRLREAKRITTRPLPLTYRLRRIGIGMALHARTALWSVIVLASVLFIFTLVHVLNVHWFFTPNAYSVETRKQLLKTAHPASEIDLCVVGIADSTIRAVPTYAASHGLKGVSPIIRTWRGMHGALMERMARAKPLVVVWDYYFVSQQPQDAGFVRGVRAMDDAGIPVVVAMSSIRDDGTPNLSDTITEPLDGILLCGLIIARDMHDAPGEYVIVARRDDRIYPSVILSAFAAIAYPDCAVEPYWPKRRDDVQLRYRKRNSREFIAATDEIPVHSHIEIAEDNPKSKKGDVLAYVALPLTPLDVWRDRTIAYERLLTADDDALTEMIGGKVVVIADTRGPAPSKLIPRDLHTVRFDDGSVVEDVPGGFLLANGIEGLIANRYRVSRKPLLAKTLSILIGMSFVGCLAAVLFTSRMRDNDHAARWLRFLPALALCGAAICFAWMTRAQSPTQVQIALALCALSLTFGPALLIERTRAQRRMRTM